MYGLVVRFELKDAACAEQFDQLVAETGEGIQAHEPGTLVYATHSVEGAPLSRVFYEIYQDRQAFEEHERQPHTVRFLKERDQFIESVRVEFVEPMTAKGLANGDR